VISPWAYAVAPLVGALGALLRYALVTAGAGARGAARATTHQRRWPSGGDEKHPFPSGVLAANTIASLIAGVAAALTAAGTTGRLLATAAFCGGLSTLSTLAIDTVSLWRAGRHTAAVVNLGVTAAAGVLAAAGGYFAARLLSGG